MRMLRTVARFADQWDYTYPKEAAECLDLDGVLREHCDAVGRDQSQITRSIHLGLDAAKEPAELAQLANTLFDAGVDPVVWSMGGAMDASRLEPTANALA